MSLLQAILMGIIQGLTEFLPVSSSGHLAIFKILFGVDTDTGLLFDVLLHIGTLAAICIVYYKDVLKMIVEGIGIIRDCFINLIRFIGNKTGKTDEPYLRIVNSSYRKLVVLIIVSTIPTGIIGVVGKDVVEMASEILLIPDPYRCPAFYCRSYQRWRKIAKERYIYKCIWSRNSTGNRNTSGIVTFRNNDHGMSAQRL